MTGLKGHGRAGLLAVFNKVEMRALFITGAFSSGLICCRPLSYLRPK